MPSSTVLDKKCLYYVKIKIYPHGDTDCAGQEGTGAMRRGLHCVLDQPVLKQDAIAVFIAKKLAILRAERFCAALESEYQPAKLISKPTPKVRKKSLPPRHFQHPLADAAQEALAIRIYTTLNQVTGKAQISRANARRTVFMYPAAIIEDTLKCMNTPSFTNRTYNPTGFFSYWLEA